jgi:hypothetical protein
MILKIFSPKKFAKNLAFLTRNKAKFGKKFIITLVFKKNANFFRPKLGKIAENCDHNIDPWSPWSLCTLSGIGYFEGVIAYAEKFEPSVRLH